MDATIVLDIGKTNAKLTLLDPDGATIAQLRRPNEIASGGAYPHHDVDAIWDWMLASFRAFSKLAKVSAIVPVTHGATAALVDDDGLVLPVLDYESALPQALDLEYAALRPSFADTCSPSLPAGLNLGRQLAWLAAAFPARFARARYILMYPQYWAWRLSGVAAGEVTSLGCHTDLWNPVARNYSALVESMEWNALMPPLQSAWAPLGPLRAGLAAATGLPEDCQVICGIHDSNASLLRHLDGAAESGARTVLSTGTWVIAAAFGAPLDCLDEQADMLANTNALGQPVACMRYMGGREFAAIAGADSSGCTVDDLERMIARGSMALPCFADAGGPFSGRTGQLTGPAPRTAAERYALATLYAALMTDYCLSALQAAGPITVEGSFTGNPHFGGLLAALRPQQPVAWSDDASGTTCGGWMLHRWGRPPAAGGTPAAALDLAGWQAYRERWLAAIGN
jgi:L-fuculokinase